MYRYNKINSVQVYKEAVMYIKKEKHMYNQNITLNQIKFL